MSIYFCSLHSLFQCVHSCCMHAELEIDDLILRICLVYIQSGRLWSKMRLVFLYIDSSIKKLLYEFTPFVLFHKILLID
jgi:hypothetical protein